MRICNALHLISASHSETLEKRWSQNRGHPQKTLDVRPWISRIKVKAPELYISMKAAHYSDVGEVFSRREYLAVLIHLSQGLYRTFGLEN
jgi:hypothetical protein